MSSGMKERLCRSLEKVLHAETRELPAVAGGILLFFLLFLAYSMLRPVRETMGIAGGVQNLQWLFTATFAASIGGQFLFGWVSSKVRRKAILPWTYGFFILNLAVFAALVLGNRCGVTAREMSGRPVRFMCGCPYLTCLPFPWRGACCRTS